MKAIVVTEEGIEQKEIELGFLPKQWARIEVARAGLCGSDVAKILGGTLPLSHTRILGHEFYGQIVEFNGHTTGISTGDWVVGMPVLGCGTCYACTHQQQNLCTEAQAIGRTLSGAFAEFVDIPLANVVRISNSHSLDPYVLADPLAVCVHASKLGASTSTFQNCLVIGDGAIGSLLAWLLREQGCNTWIKGVHPDNLCFIERFGVKVLTTESVNDYFDVVYETVGRAQFDTLNESLRTVRWGGCVIVLGVFASGYTYPLIARDLFMREVQLKGSNAYVPTEFKEAVELISTHSTVLCGFISHRFPLFRFQDALVVARQKQGYTMKIILQPTTTKGGQ